MRHKILITGGTKGIGRAAAEALLACEQTDAVWLTYASDSAAAAACRDELLSRYPTKELYISQLDVAAPEAPQQVLDEAKALGWYPTAVLFNANLTYREPFGAYDADAWRRVFDANVHFPVFLTEKLAPLMEPGGVFVFTGSMMAVEPHGTSLAYAVTKSAVHALVRNLVKHIEPYRHRTVGIAPGFVDTEWQKNKPAEIRRNIENKVALHRFATPEEIGEVFRLAVENSYLNGDIITVSGGYSYK